MAKIHREQVISSALELLNEIGLHELTTRKLAKKLGVESATLYWHFKSKDILLEEMASAVLEKYHSIQIPTSTDDWKDWLAQNARSFRRALLSHQDGALLHAGTNPARVGRVTYLLKVEYLVRSGLTEAEAAMTLKAIGEYTLGCVLEEQAYSVRYNGANTSIPFDNKEPYPGSIELVLQQNDAHFEFGLSLFINGLDRR